MADAVDVAVVVLMATLAPYLLLGGTPITRDIDNSLLLGSCLTALCLIGRILITRSVEAFLDGILLLLGGALAWTAMAILFGAPFVELISRTMLWGLLQSSLTLLPIAKAHGRSESRWELLRRMVGREMPTNSLEIRIWSGFYGASVGCWLGALPIPLDWDEPWQAWPITLYYGSLFGWITGLIVGALLLHRRRQHGDGRRDD